MKPPPTYCKVCKTTEIHPTVKSGTCADCLKAAGKRHPLTSSERSEYDLCGARKKNGELCRAFAGQGTDHSGVGHCKNHGGSTVSHRSHAVTIEAQRTMALGSPIELQPTEALRGLLHASAGHVAFLSAEVGSLEDTTTMEAAALIRTYNDERDRLLRVGEVCVKAGISSAEVALAESQTAAIAKSVESAFGAVKGLTADQRAAFGQTLRLELQALQKEAAEPIEAS